MAVGVWLHVSEHHEHEHVHESLTHTHSHRHDEHHQHEHTDLWDEPSLIRTSITMSRCATGTHTIQTSITDIDITESLEGHPADRSSRDSS